MNFQKITIIVAVLLLVIILIFIGINISRANSNVQWPPLVADCPDYWVDTSGNGQSCINKLSLGTCNLPDASGNFPPNDFTISPYVGSQGTCSKYKWANKCGVTWDGITSGISNPCVEGSSQTKLSPLSLLASK